MESKTPAQEAAVEPESLDDVSPITEDELQEIIEGARALEEILSKEPVLKTDIETIIREQAKQPITSSTLGLISRGLNLYIDFTDMAYLVAFLISEDENVQKEYKAHTSEENWNWLRRMLALYGAQLKEAEAISEKDDHAWRVFYRRVYFDTVINEWGVTIEIVKYNGERITLEDTLGGILFLADGIVNALNTVPPEAALDLIPREDIERVLADVIDLSNLFSPGLLDELAEEGDQAQDERAEEGSQVKEE
jgi:hypothetical protein